MVLRAFLLFTLTKSLWRQWPLISEVWWLIPFYRQLFFHHKLQGNAWLRQDLSLKFPKFQFWPCTSNYRTVSWFHKLKLWCWCKLRTKNFPFLGCPQQWCSSPCSEPEMLKVNLKPPQNQQQQQNPETFFSWQGHSEVQKTKLCFGTHLDSSAVLHLPA